MEIFLDRLSDCQASEAAIRAEREALLKRQEQELINIDRRIVNIATQRNSILEDFKNFLEATPSESNPSPSPTGKQRPQSFHYVPPYTPELPDPAGSAVNIHLQVERPSSSGGSTPLSQYHSPLASPLPEIKAPIPPTPPGTEPDLALPVVENRRIIRSPIRRQNASETQLPKLPEVEPSPRQCSDLKLSITKPNPKKLSGPKSVLDSPATEKIEEILHQVKSNAHPLEEAAVNHCIDLLSSKCDIPSLALTDLSSPTPTKESPPDIDQHGSAPLRRNAMRKRVETPEERRKRIEAVLFGPSPADKKKQELSQSSQSINQLGRTQSAILQPDRPHAGPYGGRRSSGNVNMKQQSTPQQTSNLRRNQSLSPLRFGLNGRSLESIEDETTDASMEELLLRAPPNAIDKRLAMMRRAKSLNNDAQLGDSDSFSAATSFEDDFDFESESQQILNQSMDANDLDHLLAPSKVAKSQNMFQQSLFGSNVGKRLLSKEEIAKSRKLANQNRLASQRARSFETASLGSNFDRDDREKSPVGTLRAEQLVQMRGNSASPDSRQIDRELNNVANLRKFQSNQNFWEAKTKEILDKQKRFSILSNTSNDSRSSPRGQATTAAQTAAVQKPVTTTTTTPIVKPETVSPRPTKKKTPKSGNASKTASGVTSTAKASSPAKSSPARTVANPTNKVSSVTLSQQAPATKTLMKSTTTPLGTVPNGTTKEKESKSLLDRFSFFTNSSKKKDENAAKQANANSETKHMIIDSNYGRNNGYIDHLNSKNSLHSHNNNHGYVKSHSDYNNNIQARSPQPVKPEIENDQLYQRVRNIHDDIRQRKLQQQNLQQQNLHHPNIHQSHQFQQPNNLYSSQQSLYSSQQNLHQQPQNFHPNLFPHQISAPEKHNKEHRPSIQSAKSLDLQYYPLKAKQVPIKLIEPNGPEPGLAKNRFRLIRSSSKDNSTEHSSDDNADALSQVSFASTAISDCSMQHMQRPHSRNNANNNHLFRETALHKPMKSTYF